MPKTRILFDEYFGDVEKIASRINSGDKFDKTEVKEALEKLVKAEELLYMNDPLVFVPKYNGKQKQIYNYKAVLYGYLGDKGKKNRNMRLSF